MRCAFFISAFFISSCLRFMYFRWWIIGNNLCRRRNNFLVLAIIFKSFAHKKIENFWHFLNYNRNWSFAMSICAICEKKRNLTILIYFWALKIQKWINDGVGRLAPAPADGVGYDRLSRVVDISLKGCLWLKNFRFSKCPSFGFFLEFDYWL